MRRLLIPLLVALVSCPALAEDDALRDAVVRDLVWRAADAPEAEASGALEELTGFPGVTWRHVHDLLAAGRAYPAVPDMHEAVLLPEPHAAHFEGFAWEPGVVKAYELGEGYEHWYTFEPPPDYDGQTPVGVWLDLGGVLPLRDDGTPPGFARAQVSPAFQYAERLGGAPVAMTGGWLGQSIVLSVVADMERRFNVDRDRIFAAGYSRMGNATLYCGLHWPDLFAGICPSSGYYPFSDDLVDNLLPLPVLLANGDDAGHKAANEFTKKLYGALRRAKHGKLERVSALGRSVGEAISAACWQFAAAHRRDPLPKDVRYVLLDARHRGAYWIEIAAVHDPGKQRPVAIRASGGEELERFHVNTKAAVLQATVEGENVVRIRARNVRTARLRLSPELFDLSKPLTLRFGRTERKIDVTPSVASLVREFRRDRDRRRLFPAVVEFEP